MSARRMRPSARLRMPSQFGFPAGQARHLRDLPLLLERGNRDRKASEDFLVDRPNGGALSEGVEVCLRSLLVEVPRQKAGLQPVASLKHIKLRGGGGVVQGPVHEGRRVRDAPWDEEEVALRDQVPLARLNIVCAHKIIVANLAALINVAGLDDRIAPVGGRFRFAADVAGADACEFG